jgi:hypothetical protein
VSTLTGTRFMPRGVGSSAITKFYPKAFAKGRWR